MKLLLGLILFSTTLHAQAFECSGESFKVDVTSDFTGERTVRCVKNTPKGYVANGREIIYAKDGSVLSDKFFVEGKETKFEKLNLKQKDPVVAEAEQVFNSLLQALIPMLQKKGETKDVFNVRECAINEKKWIAFFLTRKSFKQTINYKDGCDIEGSFTPEYGKPFKVAFDLRHVKNFEKSDMMVEIKLELGPESKMSFLVHSGKLLSKENKSVDFSADYAVLIDPTHPKLVSKHLGGTFAVDSVFDQKVSLKFPIVLLH